MALLVYQWLGSVPCPRGGPWPIVTTVDHLAFPLGASIKIKGHLSAFEDTTIHGQFEGDIVVPAHAVTVAAGAHIEGPIAAKAVVIEGSVRGDVEATERVEIRAAGQLEGGVVTPRIVIADGAWILGLLKTARVTDS